MQQGLNDALRKKQSEDKKESSRRMAYIALGVVCAVLVAALLIWNSDLRRNSAAAVTIDGVKYTAPDVAYYYNSQRVQAYYYEGFDYTSPAEDQVYDEETGQTWKEVLVDRAVDALTRDAALERAAKADGYSLSEDAQSELDSALDSLETSWISSGYGSRDAFLRANYGSGMSYKRYLAALNRSVLAQDYAEAHESGSTYTAEELQQCYEDNRDTLDTYRLSEYVFQAMPVEAQEATEDSEAVEAVTLEEAMASAREKAEQLRARLEAGEDPEALQEEFPDAMSYLDEEYTGSSLSSAAFSEWLFDAARKEGDVTLSEYEGETYALYYVVRYQGRFRDEEQTADVRHILVSAGSLSDSPDEEAFEEAYATAEQLLEQWKGEGATEEAFAKLAEENSADTGSASNGGLITGVTSSSGYVSTFTDWALDPSRKSGDTGIVRNDGSSTVGYHVMYFVDWGGPVWQQSATSLLSQNWEEELVSACNVVTGSGLKYVS